MGRRVAIVLLWPAEIGPTWRKKPVSRTGGRRDKARSKSFAIVIRRTPISDGQFPIPGHSTVIIVQVVPGTCGVGSSELFN